MASFKEEPADEISSRSMNNVRSIGSTSTAPNSTTSEDYVVVPRSSPKFAMPATLGNIQGTYDDAIITGEYKLSQIGFDINDSPAQPATWDVNEPETLIYGDFEGDGYGGLILRQLVTNSVSDLELLPEIKGIYAGLLIVERKCIDTRYSAAAQKHTTSDQWQAMIAVHKLLLHEHYDFLLASHHPSASNALRALAIQHCLPSRMWTHGIENLLTIMQCHLPESLEFLCAFLYISYNMLTTLLETVPALEDVWLECLGDLARCFWAITYDYTTEGIPWCRIARSWYQKKVVGSPHTGRLYHHLALLASPSSLEQLALFTKSLTCMSAFKKSQSSVKTVFKAVLEMPESMRRQTQCLDFLIIEAHGSLFCGGSVERFYSALNRIGGGTLDSYIDAMGETFQASGVSAAVINLSALFAYGNIDSNELPISILLLAFEDAQHSASGVSPSRLLLDSLTPAQFSHSLAALDCASVLAFATLSVALRRLGDDNVFPLIHVMLMFVWRLIRVPVVTDWILKDVPWNPICSFLNTVLESKLARPTVCESTFPRSDDNRPLAEDYVMHGHIFFEGCFPNDWFKSTGAEEEKSTSETPAASAYRVERILWIGFQIATSPSLMRFDTRSGLFQAVSE